MAEQEAPRVGNKWISIKLSTNDKGGAHLEAFMREFVNMPHYYFDLLNFLYTAKETDTVNIIIDNAGGYLLTGIVISEAIKSTKAIVKTTAIKIAASSAALIFTNGHEKEADEWAFVMYHTASYVSAGTTRYHEDKAIYSSNLMKRIMEEAKNNLLLTDNEIVDIFTKAKDVFIPGSVINERKISQSAI